MHHALNRLVYTGIHDLRYKALMLHRNVTEANIMYTERDGKGYFILIDFDLASRVDKFGEPLRATPRHKPGGLPFMAYELLMDMHDLLAVSKEDSVLPTLPHCIRFDYQSLFWVCLWCAATVVTTDQKFGSALQEERYKEHLIGWQTGKHEAMSTIKSTIITNPSRLLQIPLSPRFENMRLWLLYFRKPFANGMAKLTEFLDDASEAKLLGKSLPQETFEQYETMHGEVTRDTLLAQFDKFDTVWAEMSSSSQAA